jgi:serine/threonine protein kinase/tetratricopeptide (TPR) repeat protein
VTGQTISHYRILEKLGEGGMGVVYKAEDLTLQRTVALKFLTPYALGDPDAEERFLREARATAGLDHPNVCTIFEIGKTDGHTFLAMGFVDGQTVKAKVEQRPLPVTEVLQIALQAAEGLRAAHGKGIVHRDIKSANLMVTSEGIVKVMDFGLAQLSGQSGLTKSRSTLGTASYMSPEQAEHRGVDRRSDIWSLGVVIYEMLTGTLPFKGEHEAAVLYGIVHSSPEPVTSLRAGLPPSIEHVLRKALAKDPDDRYQHVEELIVDLQSIQQGSAIKETAWLPSRRNLLIGSGVAAAAVAGIAFNIRPRTASSRMWSMVVLPLVNLSGDPEQEYFADGITDALTTDLSKISSLRMISRQTAMNYKGSKKALREIASELKVTAAVGGSVAREAGKVRVNAHLTDAATDQNLWADSYERDLTSIIGLQGEVTRAIAKQVRVALSPDEEARLSQSRKVNPETYEAYLKGLFWLNKGTPEAFDKAVTFFQEAVDKDPADPLAYAGLATGYVTAGHLSDSPEHRVPRARAAAERALQLDDSSADAHLALGVLEAYRDWKWVDGSRRMDRALAINPNFALAHFQKGWIHIHYGRVEEAIASGEKALQLDPLSGIFHWAEDFYRIAGRHEEAIRKTKAALESNPKLSNSHIVLASTYAQMGRHDEAISEFRRAVEKAPHLRGYLAMAYIRAGRRDEAKPILAEYERMKLSGWTAFWRGTIHGALGNNDEAFQMLNYEPHHDWLGAVAAPDPLFVSDFKLLHGDPRFAALIKRMGLPGPKI